MEKGRNFFDKAIESSPDTPEGYLGKLLAQLHLTEESELKNCKKDYTKNPVYVTLMQKADVDLYNRIIAYAEGKSNAGGEERRPWTSTTLDFLKRYKLGAISVCAALPCMIFAALLFPGNGNKADSPATSNPILAFELSADGTYYSVVQCDPSATYVDIPGNYNGKPVTTIRSYTFFGCESLETVSIPDTVTTIERYAFSECPKLGIHCAVASAPEGWDDDWQVDCSVWYNWLHPTPDNVTGQGGSPITYTLSDSKEHYVVSDWDDEAEVVVIPDEYNGLPVREIGEDCFSKFNCRLTLHIPDTVTYIHYYAFGVAELIMDVTVDEANKHYKSVDGNLYSKDGRVLVTYATGKRDESFTVPDGVELIEHCAFQYCESIKSITLPDSVTYISYYAFSGCRALESINLPEGITTIEGHGFSGCENLTDVSLPSTVQEIGYAAFSGTGISELNIPASLSRLSSASFSSCDSLVSVTVDSANTQYVAIDNVLYTKDGKTLVFYPCGKSDTSFAIPYGVETIGGYAFCGNKNLVGISISDTVTTIREYAFLSMEQMQVLYIPESVETVERDIASPEMTVYCAAPSKPEGWADDWANGCQVVWGYTGN